MKKIIPLSLVAGLCLAPLAAAPALASPSSTTSARALAEPVLESVRITHNDPTMARVDLAGGTPGAIFFLRNITTGLDSIERTIGADRHLTGFIEVEAGILNHLEVVVVDENGEEIRVSVDADDRDSALEAPEVEVTADTVLAEIVARGRIGAEVLLRDPRGREVDRCELVDGECRFLRYLPTRAGTFTAHQLRNGVESPGTSFHLEAIDPAEKPYAPMAIIAEVAGPRAVLRVEAQPDTVVRAMAPDGTIVGVKLVPLGGAMQMVVPLTSAPRTLSLTATRGSTASSELRLRVPAAQ